MTLPPAVIVHGLDMAVAALAHGRPVTLLSAEDAGVYAGIGWWQALVRLARRSSGVEAPDILDCGTAPGRALEALRAGQRYLILRTETRLWQDIAWRAAQQGGVLLYEAPAALDLAQRGAGLHLANWLAQGDMAGRFG